MAERMLRSVESPINIENQVTPVFSDNVGIHLESAPPVISSISTHQYAMTSNSNNGLIAENLSLSPKA